MRTTFRLRLACLVSLSLTLAVAAACKRENAYVPPPPAQVNVAKPVQQEVTPYLEVTGNAAAYNQVDLEARVQGYLQEINYKDGAEVRQADALFVIEPAPYQAQLQQAQATLAATQADLVQAEAEFYRQSTLGKSDFASQSKVDEARAKTKPVVKAPYRTVWSGEFEEMEDAEGRLMIIIPLSLGLIFIFLYMAFHSFIDAVVVFSNVFDLAVGGNQGPNRSAVADEQVVGAVSRGGAIVRELPRFQ